MILRPPFCRVGNDVQERLLHLHHKSPPTSWPFSFHPTYPAIKTKKPLAATPLAYPATPPTLVKMASHPWRADSRSLNRCNLPVCVFGKASINLIARGYLYGAITAFT